MQFNIENSNNSKAPFILLSFNARAFNSNNDINRSGIDKEIVSFVKNQDPDIVCFQEFSRFEFKSFSYYPYKFIGYRKNIKKSLQVIYSKYPIVNKGYIDFPNTSNNAMFADVFYNNEIMRIYNIHLESFRTTTIYQLNNPNSYSPLITRINNAEKERKIQAELIKNHINKFKGKVIICGDFNSTQFSSIYKTLKGYRKDTFIEAGMGFGSTYKLYNYPFRLDYVLADDDFEVISHKNFKLKLSDHEPIIVKLSIN